VLLALFSVILSLLALPGSDWPLVVLISLVPLGLALNNASRTESFLYGFGSGFGGWLGATSGLIAGLSDFAQVSLANSAIVVGLVCAWMALPYGAFGFLWASCRWMDRRYAALKRAACLTLLVSWFPNPLPIDSSNALYSFPILVQILDLGGQPLLLFTIYLTNWLLLDALLAFTQGRKSSRSLLSLLALGIVVSGYGYFRLSEYRAEEVAHFSESRLRIGVIQPNLLIANDLGARRNREAKLDLDRALLAQSANMLLGRNPLDLVVWPETPTRISCDDESLLPELTAMAARFKVPFLINCVERATNGAVYNTELLIAGRDRRFAYRKQTLLPFTEYLPAERWWPALRNFFPGASRYASGDQPVVLRINDAARAIPATCYEILFRKHPREFVSRGGNVLISAANDAWFRRSRIADFQISACVYQAVQHRVPVVRVSNSGDSVGVEASGEIVPDSRTLPFTKTARVVELFLPRVRAPYFSLGDLFLYLLTATVCCSLIGAWLRKERRVG
jgi:apolipoprotein N-acyltransferase